MMVTREEIMAVIQKVPEKHLDELFKLIKNYEGRDEAEAQVNHSALAQLREIKISAAPNFSTKATLYNVEEQNAG